LTPVLAVHGGAGSLPARSLRGPARRAYERALARSLVAGQRVLARGGSAVHAVTAAVVVLEDDPLFNAGRGAVLCADGSVEMCASVMSGRNLRAGAMVGLRRVRNPVRAAVALMEHSHGLLFGAQAEAYARDAGLEMVAPGYFVTPHRVEQWKRCRRRGRLALDHGTVGAVALDRRGNLAAATSTGGLVNQLPGRVGDTPVVGAGTWADDRCAVSATGRGDAFARVAFARHVADLIELRGLEPGTAARRALRLVARVRGSGGCIVVDAGGRVAWPFTSAQMLRGRVIGDSLPVIGILPREAVEVDPSG